MRMPFARVPEQVGGRPIPRRFRRWRIHFADAGAVLADFIRWFERGSAPDGRSEPSDGQDPAAGWAQERQALVEACIEVRERIESTALRRRLGAALESAGVSSFTADGERFDPERHEALGRVRPDEPSQDNIVAATVHPGYRDGDRVVRQPRVEVYRADTPDGG